MKTVNVLKIASVAAMLAIAGPAFAAQMQDASSDNVQTQDPTSDQSGLAALGIDIRPAGTSASSIHAFLTTLSPDTRNAVSDGCATINMNSSTVSPSVAAFCRALHG